MALICHPSADLDAVCSASALYFSLFNTSEPFLFAESLNFSAKNFIRDIGLSFSNELYPHDAAIVLDFSDIEKYNLNPETTIIFDHHQPLKNLPFESIIDPSALSTCQLIYNYLKVNNARFYPETYKALALGILSDTARFKSLNKETLEIFLQLLERVDYSELTPYLEAKPFDKKVSVLKAMSKLELYSIKKRFLLAFVKIGAYEGATASFATELADICFAFSENEEENRISARTSASFAQKTKLHLYKDILSHLEGKGNGHKSAAGISTPLSYLQIKTKLLSILEQKIGPVHKI